MNEYMRAVLFCLLLCFSSTTYAQEKTPDEIEIVMNFTDNSWNDIHEQNAYNAHSPASMTKIVTLALAFQALSDGDITLQDKIRVSKYASKQDGVTMSLKSGSYMTVKQAIEATIVKSSNDTSVVLAEHIAGSERSFVEKMNHFVLMDVGITQTRFEDASGLSKSDFQFTTAYDMALIMRYIEKEYPDYYDTYFAKTSLWYRKWYGSGLRNRLTKKGVDGLKTGFINKSQCNIVASFVHDQTRWIIVLMNYKKRKKSPACYPREKRINQLIAKYKSNAPVM